LAETQESISKWAVDTFGVAGTDLSVAIRANNEMAELLTALAEDDNHPKAPEECADIIIVLMRIFARRGVNFWDVVEEKMGVNRARQWRLDGKGHGYHVG